jgi:5-methylcytosine-specific restriction enzyme B
MADADEPRLSSGRVRNLSVEELGLHPPGFDWVKELGLGDADTEGGGDGSTTRPEAPVPLAEGHELLERVRQLLDQFGGVIFVGPSGTSKSYFAGRLAMSLAGSSARVRFVQFHASYQYEDFVQGYVPNDEGSGFILKPKHLLQFAVDADRERNMTYVIVIDELSRGDAARIFGEGLTYVEKTKRDLPFSLASGDECSIPPNLVILATMNPLDRGVDDVDAAFERRFAKIAMDPDRVILLQFLADAGMGAPLVGRVVGFFDYVNARARDNPATALGHTFFLGVQTEDDLRRLWEHQLRFFFEKAYRLDPQGHREVRERWEGIFTPPAPEVEPPEAPEGEGAAA